MPIVFTSKNPRAVMVLGVTSLQGDIMHLPHFFSMGLNINQKVTTSALKEILCPG